MKTITCENDNGLSAVFAYNREITDYFLENCEGIYSISNSINTSQNATTDGDTYNGEGLQSRNIVITTSMIKNHRKNREYLARVFKVKSEGVFIHEEDGEKRTITYRVEDIDIEETGVKRLAVISLICCDPYFSDEEEITIEMARWVNDWEFEIEIPEAGIEFGHRETEVIKEIENESAREIGLTITLEANDEVVNPMIINQTTDETMKLLCTMQTDDIILINTVEGGITIELIRDNVVIDYNHTVDEENDDYIQLKMGNNVIKYDADQGVGNLDIKLQYKNKYMFA